MIKDNESREKNIYLREKKRVKTERAGKKKALGRQRAHQIRAKRRSGTVRFALVVLDGRFDGVFSEHGAVQLDWWQTELLGNFGVLDAAGGLESHATDELGQVAAGGDGGAAAKSLEFDV